MAHEPAANHFLPLHKTLAEHLIDRRLDEARRDWLAVAVAVPIVHDKVLVVLEVADCHNRCEQGSSGDNQLLDHQDRGHDAWRDRRRLGIDVAQTRLPCRLGNLRCGLHWTRFCTDQGGQVSGMKHVPHLHSRPLKSEITQHPAT